MKLDSKTIYSNKFFLPGYLILSSFVIILPALINGYPLFYSDSALYILVSNLFGALINAEELPYLSGLGYAFFIRIVTWRYSLYLVVIAQALILNILIYYSVKVLIPEKITHKYHLPIIILLALFSSMGWTASQLMPDIFTSYLILSVFLFYSWNKNSLGLYIFLSIMILLSITAHLSNISISVLLIGSLFLLFVLKRSYRKNLKVFIRKTIVVIILIFSSILILIGLNNKYYDYNGMSPTSNIFFVARLMDTGFMPEFLNEKCGEKSYEMCKYKDSLPDSYEGFLWNPESEFYKTGGWDIKIHKHEEYKTIVHDVLTSPKYLGKFLYNCAEHSLRQIVTFKIGDGMTNVYTKESSQYQTVIKYFDRREFREDFQNSKQMQGKINLSLINVVNYILLAISILMILWTFIFKKLDKNMFLFTFIVFSSVLINAAATSSLSSVFNRFQARIIWLIPLLACVYFFKYLYPKIRFRINILPKKNLKELVDLINY